MLEYESLSPGTRERVEQLARDKRYSLEEALEEIAIESIAMGGLTLSMRTKAKLIAIPGRPKGEHLIRVTTEPI